MRASTFKEAGEAQRRRLEELAKDRRNEVYEFRFDEPEAHISAPNAAIFARDLWRARLRIKEKTDAEAREILLRDDAVSTYSRTHPEIFRRATSLQDGAKAVEMVQRMALLRSRVDDGTVSEQAATAAVNSSIMKECGRPPTAEEAVKIASGSGEYLVVGDGQ